MTASPDAVAAWGAAFATALAAPAGVMAVALRSLVAQGRRFVEAATMSRPGTVEGEIRQRCR